MKHNVVATTSLQNNPASQVVSATDINLGFEDSKTDAVDVSGANQAQNVQVEFQEKIDAVRRTTSEQPMFYGVGVALRKLWDVLPSFNLPLAQAQAADLQENDAELEDALKRRRPRVKADPGADKRSNINQEVSEIMENVIGAFRSVAAQGPETRKLILQCLNNVQTYVYDPEFSKEIKYNELDRMGFVGGYLPAEQELRLVENFRGKGYQGKNLLSLIKHECTHVHQRVEDVTYDDNKLENCIENIDKLKYEILDFFQYGNNLDDYLQAYSEMFKDSFIFMEAANLNDVKRTEFDDVTLVSKLTKGVNPIIFHEELVNVENNKLGVSRSATTEEKNLYGGLVSLAQVMNGFMEVLRRPGTAEDKRMEITAKMAEIPLGVLYDEKVGICKDGLGERPNNQVRVSASTVQAMVDQHKKNNEGGGRDL